MPYRHQLRQPKNMFPHLISQRETRPINVCQRAMIAVLNEFTAIGQNFERGSLVGPNTKLFNELPAAHFALPPTTKSQWGVYVRFQTPSAEGSIWTQKLSKCNKHMDSRPIYINFLFFCCCEGRSANMGGSPQHANKQTTILRCGCTEAARSKRPNTPGPNPIPYSNVPYHIPYSRLFCETASCILHSAGNASP